MSELVTFKEILEFTGLSHNSVSKKIEKLGIVPLAKSGRTKLYAVADMERINEYKPLAFNPKTVFYRVSIKVGGWWIVVNAGITISKARRIVMEYTDKGVEAKFTACK